MQTNRVMVLIPYWIQETLNRHNLPIAKALDLNKIREFCSTNDLAAFLRLNEPEAVERCFGAPLWGNLYGSWLNTQSKLDDEATKFTCFLQDLSKDPSFALELEGRLFDPAAKQNQYQTPFITYDLTPEVCGVVIYPGFFCVPVAKDLQISLVEAVLKPSYAYQQAHEVARSPLFERYLGLLG